jgi:hypothetical protein
MCDRAGAGAGAGAGPDANVGTWRVAFVLLCIWEQRKKMRTSLTSPVSVS